MELKFKHTLGGLKTPKLENGMINIYATEDVLISPSESKYIKTGTAYEVPEGYALVVIPVTLRVSLRFANAIVVLTSKDKEELGILIDNVVPRSYRNDQAVGYFLINGSYVKDYQKGYQPINTILIQKGDLIGKAFLVKMEEPTISRTTKKVQEKKNETDEQ